MRYEIKGDSLPVVICHLDNGESLVSEGGAMGWMTDGIHMDTNMKGGLLGGLGRAFSGESVFLNTFSAKGGNQHIAFPSSFPGKIVDLKLNPGQTIIAQKGAFLAGTSDVRLEVAFKKKIGAGFFGGEGFILQKITGPGTTFLEFDGHVEEYDLSSGETLLVDTGNVAMFEASVAYDIQMVKGIKNIFLGGEGLFLTKLTGPGKVYLQSMPIQNLAGQLARFFNTGNN